MFISTPGAPHEPRARVRARPAPGSPAPPPWGACQRRGDQKAAAPPRPPPRCRPGSARWPRAVPAAAIARLGASCRRPPARPSRSARRAGRSRCSGGDSRELGGARCPHGQAAAARASLEPARRMPRTPAEGRAAAGVVNLTQVARGWESGVRGSGSARNRRLARRRRALPNSLQLPRGLVSPCLALPEAVTRAPRSAAKHHLQVGALLAASERAPRSSLYNPRPGRASGGLRPPSARPSPPPGAPRPRPSPQPARSPRTRGGAAPLTWPWPQPPGPVAPPFSAHAPCRGVSRPPPARSGGRERPGHPPPAVRSSLVPASPLSLTRGDSGRPAL